MAAQLHKSCRPRSTSRLSRPRPTFQLLFLRTASSRPSRLGMRHTWVAKRGDRAWTRGSCLPGWATVVSARTAPAPTKETAHVGMVVGADHRGPSCVAVWRGAAPSPPLTRCTTSWITADAPVPRGGPVCGGCRPGRRYASQGSVGRRRRRAADGQQPAPVGTHRHAFRP